MLHYSTFEDLISRLKSYTFNKSVLLLGSAPVACSVLKRSDIICSVNASHAAYGLDRVDILFLNSYSLQPGKGG